MPFSIDTFRQYLKMANDKYAKHKDSSMSPLERHLAGLHAVGATQLPAIQALWGAVPYAKQTKYAGASMYLKQFLPGLVDATPCKPKMEFESYKVAKGPFAGQTDYLVRAYHRHKLTWQSSNGHMGSLANVGTREQVTHRTNPAAAPFHAVLCGSIPLTFTQGATTNAGADSGINRDDHSIGNPALILRRPLTAGSVIADQVYQYTTDGTTWLPIPGATYEIEKGVRLQGGNLVFYFRKEGTNNRLANRFHFEVEYAIGPAITTTITRIPVPPFSYLPMANLSDHTSRIVAQRQ
ncbi:hypothetical protein [Thalassomonas sp. RHCl1]|uniref:hypothetical protein n=1 Tax=Thalassomonas sp. RHCl1 TaxID=2995320 RepID=UPI00248CD507|nr:hypothetical protein [Thalassomonas sp. RHCl1]